MLQQGKRAKIVWATVLGGLVPASLASTACIKRECVCPGSESATVAGSSPGAPLPPGTPLLGADDVGAFQVFGDAKKVDVRPVDVEGQPFRRALRADVKEPGGSEWSVQMQARTTAAVEKGDLLHATFYVRSVKEQEGGGAETSFVFEHAGEPYTKSVTYPVRLTPEWRQVAVRFTAEESYGAGEAQLIFRLGYEPETIEIGGISVVNYQKKVAFAKLPTTEGVDRKIATASVTVEAPLPVVEGGELAFEIAANQVVRPISPYVYGINAQNAADTGATVRRLGGNRGSVYNWELNASSAGNDWQHLNDDWPCTVMGYKNCDKPGAQYLNFVEDNKKQGIEAVITIPMLDYASADKKGTVKDEEKAPSKRFVRAYPKKKGALSETPDLADGAVYQDEFVNLLVKRLGRAAQGGAKFYSLDNEPALWKSTHPRVHANPTSYKEVVDKSEATATSITALDPTAFVLGGIMFGWSEYMSLNSAPDAKEHNAKYETYVEYFLASMRALEQKHGRRLIHALDVHWYPESRGTKRITEPDTSRKTIEARVQAPRSFWDPTFDEKSWITGQRGKPIRLIPWLFELIAERYPGTKLSMTEYNFGTGDHISGGLAQADALGIFGREGVYLANYWGNGAGVGDLPPYIAAAFRLYRNFDGKGGRFGDTAVIATTPNIAKATIYAATDTKTGALTAVVINKDQQHRYKAKLALKGAECPRAEAYQLEGKSPKLQGPKPVTVEKNELRHELPPLSATLFVCRKS